MIDALTEPLLAVSLLANTAIAVRWWRRRGRGRGSTPDRSTSDAAVCSCGRGFASRAAAYEHARDIHNAPDDRAAEYLLTFGEA